MTQITAKAIRHTKNPETGKEIITLQLKYPRFIHGQLLTHRQFSRNSSSSRAIPVSRLIEEVETDPVNPLFWGKNKPGMQAIEELASPDKEVAQQAWDDARKEAIKYAKRLAGLEAHKQIVNRILEPFQHIHTVLTATEFENFFNLRIHDDAQPEIQALAKAIKEAIDNSTPLEIVEHIPYLSDIELQDLPTEEAMKISAARCARVSYLNHDGSNPDLKKDYDLADKLLKAGHMSPFEHQAFAHNGKAHNLVDWKSQRAFLEYKET